MKNRTQKIRGTAGGLGDGVREACRSGSWVALLGGHGVGGRVTTWTWWGRRVV
jgi:hypothetical protein